jgi:antitoxin VapB
MPLNVKNQEADELARELARRTGRSITDVIIIALREMLIRERARAECRPLREELEEISRRCSSLPDLDRRTPEEIIGFDECGVPS